ncbi:predicted protein [Streptomyces sp. AA4]|nr:predicted protein [Streptomyces sp. AA4]
MADSPVSADLLTSAGPGASTGPLPCADPLDPGDPGTCPGPLARTDPLGGGDPAVRDGPGASASLPSCARPPDGAVPPPRAGPPPADAPSVDSPPRASPPRVAPSPGAPASVGPSPLACPQGSADPPLSDGPRASPGALAPADPRSSGRRPSNPMASVGSSGMSGSTGARRSIAGQVRRCHAAKYPTRQRPKTRHASRATRTSPRPPCEPPPARQPLLGAERASSRTSHTSRGPPRPASGLMARPASRRGAHRCLGAWTAPDLALVPPADVRPGPRHAPVHTPTLTTPVHTRPSPGPGPHSTRPSPGPVNGRPRHTRLKGLTPAPSPPNGRTHLTLHGKPAEIRATPTRSSGEHGTAGTDWLEKFHAFPP